MSAVSQARHVLNPHSIGPLHTLRNTSPRNSCKADAVSLGERCDDGRNTSPTCSDANTSLRRSRWDVANVSKMKTGVLVRNRGGTPKPSCVGSNPTMPASKPAFFAHVRRFWQTSQRSAIVFLTPVRNPIIYVQAPCGQLDLMTAHFLRRRRLAAAAALRTTSTTAFVSAAEQPLNPLPTHLAACESVMTFPAWRTSRFPLRRAINTCPRRTRRPWTSSP